MHSRLQTSRRRPAQSSSAPANRAKNGHRPNGSSATLHWSSTWNRSRLAGPRPQSCPSMTAKGGNRRPGRLRRNWRATERQPAVGSRKLKASRMSCTDSLRRYKSRFHEQKLRNRPSTSVRCCRRRPNKFERRPGGLRRSSKSAERPLLTRLQTQRRRSRICGMRFRNCTSRSKQPRRRLPSNLWSRSTGSRRRPGRRKRKPGSTKSSWRGIETRLPGS
mmetsp:Transcript_121533/g.303255  ORF Transcript_121533/g.303255 Transcript_121533/m.303255 type:complete len:219 (-) Transcript_121533:66-722(-)